MEFDTFLKGWKCFLVKTVGMPWDVIRLSADPMAWIQCIGKHLAM